MKLFGKYTVAQVRKAVIAVAGVAVLLLNSAATEFADFIPAGMSVALTAAIGFLTALGVFLAKNAPLIDAADTIGSR